ncbi:MAG TPA: ATP-binding protein [Bryobacteraceae bacterium]|nr:ATP-binding protein [Bryobacteraceae bacterium]
MAPARKASKKQDIFFEKTPVALLAVSLGSLRIQSANQAARGVLGRENIEGLLITSSLGLRLQEILARDSSRASHSCKILDVDGTLVCEVEMISHQTAGADTVLVAIQNFAGRMRPEQLRQSQRMEAMGMLAGGIAHDFNNLLTIIAGYSQMLQSSVQMKTERDKTALEQVLKACERAADLTAQLLAFSRRQNAQPKVIEVAAVVNQTVGMLRRLIGEDIDLRIHNASDVGRTYADSGQLQQILLNLAINARDAMPEGGVLTIETSNVELNEDYSGQHLRVKPGDYVLLRVSDTGAGMDEMTRKRVFEPFFTTKPQGKGTGLGLSTVYGIVSQCNGSIDIYTAPGHGATFEIYLPRVHDAPMEELHSPRRVRGGRETLMLVEDEEGVRKLARAVLERAGYRVLVAASGPEALETAQHYTGSIDLLITDMVMPRMNGRELARRFEGERPGTPVLYMSGYLETSLETATGKDAPEFMQKPFAPFDLTARVRQILDSKKGNNGAARAM